MNLFWEPMNLFWVVWNVNIFLSSFGCVQTSATLVMPRKKDSNEQADMRVVSRDEKPDQKSLLDEKSFKETKLDQEEQTSTGKRKNGDRSDEAGSDRGGKTVKGYSVTFGLKGDHSGVMANLVEFMLENIPAIKQDLRAKGYTDIQTVVDSEGNKSFVGHRIGPLPIPEMGKATQQEREVAKRMHDKYVAGSSRAVTPEK